MKLVKISSNSIQIRSNDNEFSNIRINDLLSVSDDEIVVVAMVTDIKNTESEEDGFEGLPFGNIICMKEIDCSIIGSVTNGLFSSTIERYPTTDVKIHQICSEEFNFGIEGFHHGITKGKCFVVLNNHINFADRLSPAESPNGHERRADTYIITKAYLALWF